MNDNSAELNTDLPPVGKRRTWSEFVVVGIVFYLAIAYLLLPWVWRKAEGHPALKQIPQIARTHDNIPGDPLNIALIGSESVVSRSMLEAGWFPADPLTLKSCLRIASDTVLRRTYDDAPVSNLYVWGHKQDLAFEQPVGHDPRQRHHVRFWQSQEVDANGRPLWIGGATYDRKVGFSHTTGQITHHISPDVDQERDKVLNDLQQAGAVIRLNWIESFHDQLKGRNGGGDEWRTDGRLPVVTLTE